MIKLALLAMGISLVGSGAWAQSTPVCASAGDAGNSYEICAAGVCERSVCNGTAWVTQSTWANAGWQSIKFGNDTTPCTTSRAGRLRYNGGTTWQYCNGTGWISW
jgi:hypothetical protein